ncbi:conserved hypothetical protein [Alteracholeplasma palmae J233]|uniref:Carboxymuconolactone decarboxylase-like domain-containing protein n=1 Tax=Alteracholeplasma palmae (strain ATCC 49389 / J233) TaxID=1318466 RepID=U4KQD8_ALTPJ|nr:carboxymuconolactone decarboxylase family protein [Alteracholeplasma palmae]CCV64525.1 conserved hypothetical protein [Alteracholeplasma palmae J233]
MKKKIDYYTLAKDKMDIILKLEKQLENTTISEKVLDYIKIRVSQLNGCAYCIGIHTKDARKKGITEDEIYLLNAWRESNIYDKKTKLVLELAETITLDIQHGISDELLDRLDEEFSDIEYIDLVLSINQINMWNRLSIAMGNTYNKT